MCGGPLHRIRQICVEQSRDRCAIPRLVQEFKRARGGWSTWPHANKQLTQIRTETRHKIGGRNQIHGRGQCLQRQLEAPADFFFANFADRADLLECTRYALLAACNVQACRRLCVVRPAAQIFAVVHLLEQLIRSVHDCFRQIDAVGHLRDFLECGYQRSIRAAHRAAILIFGVWNGVMALVHQWTDGPFQANQNQTALTSEWIVWSWTSSGANHRRQIAAA